MIEPVEIEVGEELAGEVAKRQTAPAPSEKAPSPYTAIMRYQGEFALDLKPCWLLFLCVTLIDLRALIAAVRGARAFGVDIAGRWDLYAPSPARGFSRWVLDFARDGCYIAVAESSGASHSVRSNASTGIFTLSGKWTKNPMFASGTSFVGEGAYRLRAADTLDLKGRDGADADAMKHAPMSSSGAIFPAIRAYLAAAGLAGLGLGGAWTVALHLIAAPDPGPPVLRVVATTTISTITLAALPSMAAVFVLRWSAAPRGRSDAIAGALVALVLSAAVFATVAALFMDSPHPLAAKGTLGVIAAFFTANIVAGMGAGYFYWIIVASATKAETARRP